MLTMSMFMYMFMTMFKFMLTMFMLMFMFNVCKFLMTILGAGDNRYDSVILFLDLLSQILKFYMQLS